MFSPEAGVVFQPHAVVRFTDGFEFWTEDSTNALGFLDHEPVIPKPTGTFRILLVGDSILEALQVPLASKMQTHLAAALRKAFPERKVDVVAISRSGVGQASELGFYNANRQIKPDLVILMFVGNDFANNSILLESLRSGFSPDHLPWWFPTIDENKLCKLVPPSPDWDKHVMLNPSDRFASLRARSAEDARLLNTLKPDFVDSVFYYPENRITEIYQQAVELTKCSFSFWKEAAARDGFKLLIVATDGVTIPNMSGQIDRLKKLAGELQLPLFDLYPAWASHGVANGKFKFDGHWNADGHRWSADAIFDHLVSQKLVGAPTEQK
jgi:lysophospholipase L1-like esterase